MVATSCDLNAPRCTTKAQQVRLHRCLGEVSSLITDPPGTPVIPAVIKYNTVYLKKNEPAEKFYVYSDVSHTHTLPKAGWFACK